MRGHQGLFAFLDVASGSKGSGLPYVHLDIGGPVFAAIDRQFGCPTSAPSVAMHAWGARE
jgi:leucyl aminopeptidase